VLITAQRRDFLGQFWDDLRTGETGSDDRRPTPVPGNNRDAWLGQETGRSNHELSGKRLTVGQRDPPQLGMPVLPDAFDGGVERRGRRTSY
jgi:hypothetical protein